MKRQFVWLGAVCLLVVVAWFGLAYRPAHSRLRELRADVQATRQDVSELQAKLRRLVALERNESGSRDQAKRLVGSLPTDPKVSDFIIQVQDAANAAGIDFLSIAPSLPAVPADLAATAPAAAPAAGTAPASGDGETTAPPAPAGPTARLRSIAVQVKADGEFFEIEQFTLRLEQLARALRIDDFTLAMAGEEAQGSRLSASMKLQMFMLAPQAAAGAASSGQTAQVTSEAA